MAMNYDLDSKRASFGDQFPSTKDGKRPDKKGGGVLEKLEKVVELKNIISKKIAERRKNKDLQ